MEPALLKVGRERRSASLQTRITEQYYAAKLARAAKGRQALHILADYCMLNLPSSAVVLPRGSPLTPAFNAILAVVVESGLLQHWSS